MKNTFLGSLILLVSLNTFADVENVLPLPCRVLCGDKLHQSYVDGEPEKPIRGATQAFYYYTMASSLPSGTYVEGEIIKKGFNVLARCGVYTSQMKETGTFIDRIIPNTNIYYNNFPRESSAKKVFSGNYTLTGRTSPGWGELTDMDLDTVFKGEPEFVSEDDLRVLARKDIIQLKKKAFVNSNTLALVTDLTDDLMNEEKMTSESKRELFCSLASKTKKILTTNGSKPFR